MLPYITIFGLQIPMYGVCMAVALLLAGVISIIRSRKRGLSYENLIIIAAVAICLGILCAKLLYMFVTFPIEYVWERIISFDIQFIMNTGLVFYGGLLGGVAGAFIGASIAKCKLVVYADAVVPTLPLAHAIGRLGCFFAGCCYGMECSTFPGMRFPHSVAGLSPDVAVIPTQLLESGMNLLVFGFLVWYTRKKRRGYESLFVYLSIYAVERFLLEFLRGDESRGIFGALSTSQWISIGLLAACLTYFALRPSWYKKHGVAQPAGDIELHTDGADESDADANDSADNEPAEHE